MNKKIIALLTIIIAVAVFPIDFVAYQEFYVKPFVERLPVYLKPYLNPQPFFSTIYGGSAIAVWTTLGFLWTLGGILQAVKFFKTKLKKEKRDVLKTSKLKKALPLIIAIALSIVIWTLFPMWIVVVCEKKYDLYAITAGTIVCLIICSAPTWHSIKAYREWRMKK